MVYKRKCFVRLKIVVGSKILEIKYSRRPSRSMSILYEIASSATDRVTDSVETFLTLPT